STFPSIEIDGPPKRVSFTGDAGTRDIGGISSGGKVAMVPVAPLSLAGPPGKRISRRPSEYANHDGVRMPEGVTPRPRPAPLRYRSAARPTPGSPAGLKTEPARPRRSCWTFVP